MFFKESTLMNKIFKYIIISILFFQRAYGWSDVMITNNSPFTLKLETTVKGEKSLTKGKHYIIEKTVIKPLERARILRLGRNQIPKRTGKRTKSWYTTVVTPYDKQGKQAGTPIELTQTVVANLKRIIGSKVRYGVKVKGKATEEKEKLVKLLDWKFDDRPVDVYFDDYRRAGEHYFDFEYAFNVRPYRKATFDNNKDILRVMNYNIWMRPMGAFLFDGQVERAIMIPKAIPGIFKDGKMPDVIIFNEWFELLSKAPLIKGMKKIGYPYHTKVVGKNFLKLGKVTDGGIVAFSRWRIIETSEMIFSKCSGHDCKAAKGVVYIKIEKKGKIYHIFGTHLNAGNIEVQYSQMDEISKFIANQNIPKNEPVIIAGDLNVPKFESENDKWLKVIEPLETRDHFENMLRKLDAPHPPHNAISTSTRKGAMFLDYILPVDGYQQPKKSENIVLEYGSFSQTPWIKWEKGSLFKRIKNVRELFSTNWPIRFDLSDHLPVVGVFVY